MVGDGNMSDEGYSSGPCRETRARDWLQRWDEVHLEHRLRNATACRVPDIVLKQNGIVVGAIEVFATHGVSVEKEATLTAMGVPWLEVRASSAIIDPTQPWRITEPLLLHREGPATSWRCDRHQERYESALENALRRTAAAVEAARHSEILRAAKVMDVFYPNGSSYRRIYEVREHQTDGQPTALALTCGEALICRAALTTPGAANHREARKTLLRAYERDEQKYGGRGITDSPMGWVRDELAARLIDTAQWAFAPWQEEPLATQYPRRWEWSPDDGGWVLSQDMLDVTWDRPDSDVAFDEHPAWKRRKEALRARQRSQSLAELEPVQPVAGEPVPTPDTPLARAASRVNRQGPTTQRTSQPETSAGSTRTGLDSAGVYAGSSVPLAARLNPEDFGSAVIRVIPTGGVLVLELHEQLGMPKRVLALATTQVTPDVVARVHAVLGPMGAETVWIANRYHWSRKLAVVPWLPSARDASGTGLVVMNNIPTPADEFATKFVAGDETFAFGSIRRAGRIAALRLQF
jgi:hypothetical protein